MKLPHLLTFLLSFLLAAFALAGPRKPKVVLIHSDSTAKAQDVQNKLVATGLFEQVDRFAADSATPTLAQLKDYDAALVWNFNSWHDRAALGTVIAQYVDAGYGVVQALFATSGVNNSNLGGNWTAPYTSIVFTNTTSGTVATIGALSVPDHGILNGVETFNGGTTSPRPNSATLQAGAILIASWSDGKPLVTVGPKVNRADLGFHPPSSDVSPGNWLSNTDGVKLLANALTHVMRPKVLLCSAVGGTSSDIRFTDPQSKLRATALFSAIDIYNAGSGTPPLDLLKQYDAVLTWSNASYFNAEALGNVFADYVDAGYGLVVAPFANSTSGVSLLGRWITGNYRLINTSAVSTSTPATMGAVAYSSHPIVGNVFAFDGGTNSFRSSSTSLPAHGTLVASWSDGKILVATSTLRANRADIGFYPPSDAAIATSWDSSTDGGRLMANALLYTVRPYIIIAHSDGTNTYAAAIAQRLMNLHRFSGIRWLTSLDAATPTATALRPYNAMLLYSSANFADAVTFGNRLATFVDNGGAVVESLFCNTGNVGFAFSRPNGNWISNGYDITPEGSTGTSITGNATLGSTVGPAHPVHTFVRKFNGGDNSFRQGNTPNLRGRTLLKWSDGKMLASIHNFRRRIDLGFLPISDANLSDNWNSRTDGNTLIANALTFATAMKPCPGDFNGDQQIDDADFSLFISYYNNLLDPRGDLTGDGLSEDADFSVFVQGYDVLLCPSIN